MEKIFNKQVISQSILFFGIFAVMCFLISTFYGTVVMHHSMVLRTEREIKKEKSIDYLVMGDSQALRAVDPRIVEGSFNYSSTGESYIETYYKLKHLLESDKKEVDTLLLGYGWHSFSSFRLDRLRKEFFWANKLDYLEIGRLRGKVLHYASRYIRAKFFSFATNMDNLFAFILQDYRNSEMYKGYFPKEDPFLREPNRVKKYFVKSEQFNKYMILYFEKILELAHKHDVEVVLVRFPLYQYYLDDLEGILDKDKFNAILNEKIEKYPVAGILDYKDLYVDNIDLFYNSNHLNKEGSQIFSRLFNRDLQNLVKQ